MAACAAAGTDYVDLTGEPEFVDLMWLRYHARGASAPARGSSTRAALTRSRTTSARCSPSSQLPEGVADQARGIRARRRQVLRRARTTRRSTSWGGCGRARSVARERREREAAPARGGGSGASPAGRHTTTRSPAAGSFRSRRSTRRRCCARRARSTATGPTSRYSHYLVVKRLPMLVGLGGRRGRRDRAGAASADAQPAAEAEGPGRGPVARAAREGAGSRSGWSGVGGRQAGHHRGLAAATRATARPRRCSPSRRSAWRTTSCPRRAGQLTPAVAMGARR